MSAHPFTPTYIAMAKAAEEIQAMRPPFEPGDAVFIKEWGTDVFVGSVHFDKDDGLWSSHGEVEESGLTGFWLPRLDQLLGMLGAPAKFIEAATCGPYLQEADWHDLALAVVMREKRGKSWDGKGWVKA